MAAPSDALEHFGAASVRYDRQSPLTVVGEGEGRSERMRVVADHRPDCGRRVERRAVEVEMRQRRSPPTMAFAQSLEETPDRVLTAARRCGHSAACVLAGRRARLCGRGGTSYVWKWGGENGPAMPRNGGRSRSSATWPDDTVRNPTSKKSFRALVSGKGRSRWVRRILLCLPSVAGVPRRE